MCYVWQTCWLSWGFLLFFWKVFSCRGLENGCTCNFSQQSFRQEHFYPHVFESRASFCDMLLTTIFNTHLHWQQELHKQVFQHQCLARWWLYWKVCNIAVSLCTFLCHSTGQNWEKFATADSCHVLQASKQKLAISGIKPLSKDVDRLVAILHNDGHYIVLEVNIPERKFLIYDGLSHELLHWKDHIINVLKKCILLDLSFDSSSTVCVPDAAVPPVFSRSRKPRYIINGYSITFPQSSPSVKKWNSGD